MKIRNWHAVALISCALWVAYYPALFAPLCPIDDVRMADYLLNRDSFGWQDFLLPSSSTYFRPLIWSSFIADRLLWNLEPPFMHLENLALHWLNVLLVYCLARRLAGLMGQEGLLGPMAAALLFALHPINSETVIWIAGRADLMATTFILASLYCASRYFAKRSNFWLAGVSLLFFLGCFAKETTLFVWPGLLLLGWLLLTQEKRQGLATPRLAFAPALACVPAIAGYFVLRGYALRGHDLGMRHLGKALQLTETSPGASEEIVKAGDPWAALHTMLSAAGFYARKLLQPFPLNFGIDGVSGGYSLVGVLLCVSAVLMLWRLTWSGALLLTAMSLASVALLVALGGVSWTPIAERYMYAPTALLSMSLILGGAGRMARIGGFPRRVILGGLTLILLLGGASVFARAMLWTDNLQLFRDTALKSPGFDMAQNQLAVILYERGDKKEALDIWRNLKTTGTQAASLNRVRVFVEDGQLAEARVFLEERLNNPNTSMYRGEIYKVMINVAERQMNQCADSECRAQYQGEILGLFDKLLDLTHDPFYHYRIGQFQLSVGDRTAAQLSFALAYEHLPAASIHREPAGKLAEELKQP